VISADSLPNPTLQRTCSSLTLGSRPLNVKVVGRLQAGVFVPAMMAEGVGDARFRIVSRKAAVTGVRGRVKSGRVMTGPPRTAGDTMKVAAPFFAFCLAVHLGCRGEQEIRQFCSVSTDAGDAGPVACPACVTDEDCVLVSNPCQDIGYCAPAKVGLHTTQEGCLFEHEVPTRPCGCVERNCVPKK
jgi:hypothetical protein